MPVGVRIVFCVLALASSTVRAAQEQGPVSLTATAIQLLGRTDVTTGMMEVRAEVSPHLLLIVSPAIAHTRGAGTAHQLRASATLRLPVGALRVEDRNQMIFSDAANKRYTNRLKLILPFDVSGVPLRLLAFDEVSHEFNGRGWFRNTLAAGAGTSRGVFSTDAYWAVQKDDHRPSGSLLWVQVTARLR